jgi:sugar/nucleoside kinase (ribokinase family)
MRDTALAALQIASDAGALISFDAADPFVIHAIRDLVWTVLEDYADVAFLNAEEVRVLCDEGPERAIRTVAERADIQTVVVKLGARGSLILHGGALHEIGVRRVAAVDTTGAGDAYAGGFLYGVVQGWPAQDCGRFAAAVAALTVGQVGAVVKDREALGRLLLEFGASAVPVRA